MTKYREIIRLTGLGFSQRNIMASCGVAQKTVVKVQKRARELNLSWPLDESMTDVELQRLMFSKDSSVSQNKRMPDYDYIHKELLRNGVSKKLLWTEYMEDCRANGDDPLMYSQFCYHIQHDEQKRRATMHINRKPGEQVEVDWAGDPATIIDPDTGEILKAYIFVGVMSFIWKFTMRRLRNRMSRYNGYLLNVVKPCTQPLCELAQFSWIMETLNCSVMSRCLADRATEKRYEFCNERTNKQRLVE